MKNPKIQALQDFIRNPYVLPTGQAKALLMQDGELLCQVCAKENYRQISDNTRTDPPYNNDWAVDGVMSLEMYEDDEGNPSPTCDHCYELVDVALRPKYWRVYYKYRTVGDQGTLHLTNSVFVKAVEESEARHKAIDVAYNLHRHCEHVTPTEAIRL